MNLVIKVQLIIIVSLFLLSILKNVKDKKISFKYAMLWFFIIFLMILAIFFPFLVEKISFLLGFKEMTSMVFFLGVVVLTFICFNLTKIVSNQDRKIIMLIQEVSILKNKVDYND